jgi:hypothetical protein
MSKFNELCIFYRNQVENHTDYKNACFTFIPELVENIVNNLEWPPENLTYVSLKDLTKTVSYMTEVSQLEKVVLPAEKGFWSFGLSLVLLEAEALSAPNLYPVQFVIPIKVACQKLLNETEGIFTVNVASRQKPFQVDSDNKVNEFKNISEYIYLKIKNKIEGWISWSIEQQKENSENIEVTFYLD